jgi:hypothetical protein
MNGVLSSSQAPIFLITGICIHIYSMSLNGVTLRIEVSTSMKLTFERRETNIRQLEGTVQQNLRRNENDIGG